MLIIGALEARIGTLSLDKQEKIEADAAKAERKAEKKAELEQKKKEVSNPFLRARCWLIIRLQRYDETYNVEQEAYLTGRSPLRGRSGLSGNMLPIYTV